MNSNFICITAEYPDPERISAGLLGCVGKKHAAFLQRAFMMDLISVSLKVPRSEIVLGFRPDNSLDGFRDLIFLYQNEERDRKIARKAESIALIPQKGENTGQRLASLSEEIFKMGAKRLLFLKPDTPLIDPIVLRASFELLRGNQVVAGPTFNGGYYLLGVDNHYPSLYDGIDIQRGNLYKHLIDRLNGYSMNWQELELSYDVEGPDELDQLCSDIDNLRLAGEENLCIHTEKFLMNLKK